MVKSYKTIQDFPDDEDEELTEEEMEGIQRGLQDVMSGLTHHIDHFIEILRNKSEPSAQDIIDSCSDKKTNTK